RLVVEGRRGKDPHAVGAGFLQTGDLAVVIVVVAADAGLTGRFVVLGEDRRPDRVMVPAGLGAAGPVVGRHGVHAVKPAAEAVDHLVLWPLQADHPQAGLGRQGLVEIRQVERGDIADDRFAPQLAPAGESGAKAFALLVGVPCEQRPFFVSDAATGLTLEYIRQRPRSTPPAADPEDDA